MDETMPKTYDPTLQLRHYPLPKLRPVDIHLRAMKLAAR
jgi:hypothetical protein